MKAEVKITARPGGGSSVTIDGHDIANSVTRLILDARNVEIPTLTLTLLPAAVKVEHRALVRLDDATQRALIALGWTPPGTGGERM